MTRARAAITFIEQRSDGIRRPPAIGRLAGWGVLGSALLLAGAQPANGGVDVADAERAVAAADRLCHADAGRLWGVSLCGPVIVADPDTRSYVAFADGVRSRGMLPDDVGIGNTSLRWQGHAWAMLVTPLPINPDVLAVRVMHESWHRIQQRIGLPAVDVDEDHLGTRDGRIALRLELRALAAALAAPDRPQARAALADALAARRWRQSRFPGAAQREDALERHEGVAEYTGRVLAEDPAMIPHMVQRLQEGDHEDAYARSFAYFTGPAYGMLLDRFAPGWRQAWDKRTGLAPLLAERTGLDDPAPATLDAAGSRYGLAVLQREEQARAVGQRARQDELRAQLVAGSVLIARVKGASFSFNPTRVTPLPPDGSAYGRIRAAAEWGVLDVTKAALLSPDWTRLSVSLNGATATSNGMRGDGWMLTLKPGWQVAPSARRQDLAVLEDGRPPRGVVRPPRR